MIKSIAQADQALREFKRELAEQLSADWRYKRGYWGNTAAREPNFKESSSARKLMASVERGLSQQSL